MRRLYTDGVVQRTISSIAGAMSDGSARSRRSSSGCSAKASTAPASALRVVSEPAGNSRAKKAISSSSFRPRPSSPRAWTIVDMIASSGVARLAAISSIA